MSPEKRLFITGIPIGTNPKKIKKIFMCFGSIKTVRLFNVKHKKPTICGFVEFEDTADVLKALKIQHLFCGEKRIFVKRWTNVENDNNAKKEIKIVYQNDLAKSALPLIEIKESEFEAMIAQDDELDKIFVEILNDTLIKPKPICRIESAYSLCNQTLF